MTTPNIALQEARQAIGEIRIELALLKESIGVANKIVRQALDRIELRLDKLSGATDIDVKELTAAIAEFRVEMAKKAETRALRDNAQLIAIVLTLFGVIWEAFVKPR